MPPRTGPRRKRRIKQAPLPERHFTIVHGAAWTDCVTAHRIELDDGHLVLRDQDDAIVQVVAAGRWQEIRPTTMADIPYPEETDNAPGSGATDERIDNPAVTSGNHEQATLTNENDLAYPPTEVTRGDPPERFVPSSPEEAQRILMEIERRLAPDYQDPPTEVTRGEDAPPQTPIRKD